MSAALLCTSPAIMYVYFNVNSLFTNFAEFIIKYPRRRALRPGISQKGERKMADIINMITGLFSGEDSLIGKLLKLFLAFEVISFIL